jgi:branched-subunit amino acid aminotransferase/4-amino-4-deoxychorismate lyase
LIWRKKNGVNVIEKDFSVEELLKAQEVFMTSSSLILRPFTKIDGKVINDGKPGKIARLLNEEYKKFIAEVSA